MIATKASRQRIIVSTVAAPFKGIEKVSSIARAMSPAPQRLTIHPAYLRRLGSIGTFKNQR